MQKNKHKKKLKAKAKLMIFLSILLVLFIAVLLFFNYFVNPVIIEVSEATITSMTSKSVNSAVQSVINNT